ncbi:hypothetical protein [Helicobacter brantae]|uniref:Sialidase A n=1 Tax=Helicobacter brantae TaxID=375927 RepID=A0A3D8J5A2_9HELI|nr:hypothetical protein [Helicobacter brantae]RDU72084.1 hypothetical protein CQA58_00320 [Helicobacter brantae]
MEQNALEKLKSIGAEKIREATRLDIGKIEDILEKRFEKIAPIRAKGFIKMLEKEFSLDLSIWLMEYNEFHNQRGEKKTEIKGEQKGGNALFWAACVGLVLCGGGLLYWIYSQAPSTSHSSSMPTQQPQELVVQEEVIEVLPSQEVLEEAPKVLEAPTKELSEYGESVFPNIAYNEENILFITSDTPLWVGIVNLDTKKRVSKTKKEFEIPLDKQLLLSIARGGFSASLDDEEKVFSGYKPIYLIHTKEGGLKQISKEEFILLNGGVEW